MKNTFLIALFLISANNIILGQVMRRTVPQTTNSPSTGDKTPIVSGLPEMVGLTEQKAPNFIATDMTGTEYNIENLRGKVVVMNLWGTFCPPCVKEIPELNALVDKFKGKDVVFLAPASDLRSALDGFLKENPFKYQVFPSSMAIIKQYVPKKKVPSPTDRPGSFSMILPTHLVIDQQGTIVKHLWGYKKSVTGDISEAIQQLLTKPKNTLGN